MQYSGNGFASLDENISGANAKNQHQPLVRCSRATWTAKRVLGAIGRLVLERAKEHRRGAVPSLQSLRVKGSPAVFLLKTSHVALTVPTRTPPLWIARYKQSTMSGQHVSHRHLSSALVTCLTDVGMASWCMQYDLWPRCSDSQSLGSQTS